MNSDAATRRGWFLGLGFSALVAVTSGGCARASRPDLDDPVGRTSLTSASMVGTVPVPRWVMEAPGDRSAEDTLRAAVLDDETLSPAAKSITVTTVDGTLVLKGRVENERERETILTEAHEASDAPLRDLLTVAHP